MTMLFCRARQPAFPSRPHADFAGSEYMHSRAILKEPRIYYYTEDLQQVYVQVPASGLPIQKSQQSSMHRWPILEERTSTGSF